MVTYVTNVLKQNFNAVKQRIHFTETSNELSPLGIQEIPNSSETDDDLLAAIEKAITNKGTINHTIIQGVFVGVARSGKDSLMRRLLNEKAPGKYSPSTGIAEKTIPLQVECVTANVDQMSSKWTRMQYDDEAIDLMVKTSHSYQPDMTSNVNTAASDNELLVSDSSVSINLQTDSSSPLKTSSGDKVNLKMSQDTTSIGSAPTSVSLLSSFKNAIKEGGMKEIRKHYEQTWSLYLTNTGGQREFQELLPLLVSGPSVFFLTFPLHKNLCERLLTEYQSSDGKTTQLYTTSSTLIECILQTLATVAAMGTREQRKQIQLHSKVLLVGTHKDQLGDASLAKQKIKEIDQMLQKVIRPTSHFTNDLIKFSSENQMIFTVNNLSDKEDDNDFNKLRTAVEQCVSNGKFVRQYPAHWLIFNLILRQRIQEKIASYDECYTIAQSCGISDKEEFNHALQFIHSTMGVIHYFDYEEAELNKIIVIDPQILFDLVTDLVVKTFTHDRVGVCKHEDFIHRGIFSHDELVSVASKRRVHNLLRLDQFVKLLEILHIVAPFNEQSVEKYFFPCVLPHANYPTGQDDCVSVIPPPLLLTFACKYCPMGIAGALSKYLVTNEMKSKFEWELLSDKIFRNEISLRVGPHDIVKFSFLPTFIEIKMLETEVTERAQGCSKKMVCNEIKMVVEQGITKVSADINYTNAEPSMTFYCTSKKCQQDKHPGVPKKYAAILVSLKCDRCNTSTDLPNGHEMWGLNNEIPRQCSFISGNHNY